MSGHVYTDSTWNRHLKSASIDLCRRNTSHDTCFFVLTAPTHDHDDNGPNHSRSRALRQPRLPGDRPQLIRLRAATGPQTVGWHPPAFVLLENVFSNFCRVQPRSLQSAGLDQSRIQTGESCYYNYNKTFEHPKKPPRGRAPPRTRGGRLRRSPIPLTSRRQN